MLVGDSSFIHCSESIVMGLLEGLPRLDYVYVSCGTSPMRQGFLRCVGVFTVLECFTLGMGIHLWCSSFRKRISGRMKSWSIVGQIASPVQRSVESLRLLSGVQPFYVPCLGPATTLPGKNTMQPQY